LGTEIEAQDAFLAETAVAIRRLAKNVTRDVVEIGRRLTEAKTRCGHGNWLPWLDHEFNWGERTARNFMRVFELSKSESFADLESLEISALYQLAAPSTPESVRDDVFARVRAGEAPTLSDIRRAVRYPRISQVEDITAESTPPPRISQVEVTAESGPTIGYDYHQLPRSEPAVAERTLTADDFQNALLEGFIKDLQWLENKYNSIQFMKDGLADLRRQASVRLKPKPPQKGSGIRVVK
jgi:Protein of unknown function (DUF3102)